MQAALAKGRMNVPITKPYFGPEEETAVAEVLRSGWVVQGPQVAKFEELIAQFVGARHAVATSSCTTALHLALAVHGIGLGDEVLVPSFTFIATANAVCYTRATPVFVDIDPQTHNMDPACIEAAITPHTKAIMPVHQLGLAADMHRLNDIAHKNGLIVLEDAAPALGATYHGKPVGGLGNTTCFSFHPRKAITSGEGGMIVTNDETYANHARTLRTHGMSLSDLARHHSNTVAIEEYYDLGYNYRLSDLHAAVGIVQLRKLDFVLERRKQIAAFYNEALADIDGVQLPFSSEETPHTYQSYMIQLHPPIRKERDRVMREMLEFGVATRRGVMAIHMEPYYHHTFPNTSLPVTETATRQTILLPIFPTMTGSEQSYVVDQLRRILRA
jgi:dTDP-4-amino-4,6-dideoxygalactose transaminase